MSKLKRFIWTILTAAAASAPNFAFQDDEDFSDHRFRRESSGDYDSSGDGPEVNRIQIFQKFYMHIFLIFDGNFAWSVLKKRYFSLRTRYVFHQVL